MRLDKELSSRTAPGRAALRALGLLACTLLGSSPIAFPQNSTPAPVASLAPFGVAGELNPAWRVLGLPGNRARPVTRFEVLTLAGETVLQVSTDRSYGLLVHAWHGPAPAQLEWRWRVDQPLAQTDIKTRVGDDAALKVCVLFDQPLSDIPMLQRAALSLARTVSGQDLPSASLCYVWDPVYPSGSSGANPHSARIRYIVLDGHDTPPGQWRTQRRRVAEDFQRLFGMESAITPPVLGLAVSADSDNTQAQSVGYVSQLRWLP